MRTVDAQTSKVRRSLLHKKPNIRTHLNSLFAKSLCKYVDSIYAMGHFRARKCRMKQFWTV
ncbi:hypothetical protein C1O25_22305 [Vibrio diazotrophicus]|uniref:Uncharacterized protein n=1 Tax=Vibrio diazotrophicus TaxID=685 RepID=A0ABX4W4N2_VIBDI|nr:hypothetical protein C1O25_22305 [Vibrio diazotrophicus]